MNLRLFSLIKLCDMKNIIFVATGLVLAPVIVMAQKKLPDMQKDTLKNKSAFILNSRLLTFSQLDQRKIYHWGNGQRSTPTGRQAGENTPKYVRVFGDSAMVVWDLSKNQYLAKNRSPW